MALTPDQKTAAIKAAADIVVALIQSTAAYKSMGMAVTGSDAAAAAFKKTFEAIKQSAD